MILEVIEIGNNLATVTGGFFVLVFFLGIMYFSTKD